MSPSPKPSARRPSTPTALAVAAMSVAVVSLALSLGGFAGAQPPPRPQIFSVLAVASGSVQFDLEAMEENGEFPGMVIDVDNASFTQEAGATLLFVAELESDLGFPEGRPTDENGDQIPVACSAFAFFEVDGIPNAGNPQHGMDIAGAGLSAFPTDVVGIAPSDTDRPGTVGALASASCDPNSDFPFPEDPITVELQVAVLSFG